MLITIVDHAMQLGSRDILFPIWSKLSFKAESFSDIEIIKMDGFFKSKITAQLSKD